MSRLGPGAQCLAIQLRLHQQVWLQLNQGHQPVLGRLVVPQLNSEQMGRSDSSLSGGLQSLGLLVNVAGLWERADTGSQCYG